MLPRRQFVGSLHSVKHINYRFDTAHANYHTRRIKPHTLWYNYHTVRGFISGSHYSQRFSWGAVENRVSKLLYHPITPLFHARWTMNEDAHEVTIFHNSSKFPPNPRADNHRGEEKSFSSTISSQELFPHEEIIGHFHPSARIISSSFAQWVSDVTNY